MDNSKASKNATKKGPPDISTIGGRILGLRNKNALTQEWAARKFNVTKSTFCRWEKNERTPGADILLEMSRTWGVTMEYIMCGADRHMAENIVDISGLTFQQINTVKFIVSELRKVAT